MCCHVKFLGGKRGWGNKGNSDLVNPVLNVAFVMELGARNYLKGCTQLWSIYSKSIYALVIVERRDKRQPMIAVEHSKSSFQVE